MPAWSAFPAESSAIASLAVWIGACRILQGLSAIAFLDLFNDALDRHLRGHLSGLVPTDPIGNHNQQHRASRRRLEARDRQAVLVDLAGQPGVSVRRHSQVGALRTDHAGGILLTLGGSGVWRFSQLKTKDQLSKVYHVAMSQ